MTKMLLLLPLLPKDLLDKVRLDYYARSHEAGYASMSGTEKRLLSAFGLSNVLSNTTRARTSNDPSYNNSRAHLSDKQE